MITWSRDDLMIVTAARTLADRQRVFVGIGLPNVVCNLARRLHAPDIELVYESGVIGARPERLPVSIGDPTLVSGAAAVCSLPEVFLYYLQRGLIDVGFLGAAQIDRYGHLNTTVVGDYAAPKVRLPGSGGACDIARLAKRTLVVARQTPRLLVERVDFVTSRVGSDPSRRQPEGSDPSLLDPTLLVTDLAVYAFEGVPAELTVRSIHPGVTREELQARIPWDIAIPDTLPLTPVPTDHDLAVLREVRSLD